MTVFQTIPCSWLFCGAAAADDDEAAEDKDCSEDFLPGECVHAYRDADCYGYDRLYVAVHADQGWSDAFLGQRNQEVSDECRTDDQVGEFGILF